MNSHSHNFGSYSDQDRIISQTMDVSELSHMGPLDYATLGHLGGPTYNHAMLAAAVGDLSYSTNAGSYYPLQMDGSGCETPPSVNFDEDAFSFVNFNFDPTSSNASYAASQYDAESYLQSPVSPTFSNVLSVASGALSVAMSPEMSAPVTPSVTADDTTSEVASPERFESDDLLDELLSGLEPSDLDGKYHCVDVQADGHSDSCDFTSERKCMLRKHLESTLKTNVCRHPECNGAQFSSKAVLTRHEKEAHGLHAAHPFFCPVKSCERHNRGFPREYNMGDHIQRVHRDLDVNEYLKKSKRASGGSGKKSSPSLESTGKAVSSGSSHKHRSSSSSSGAVRKSNLGASSARARRERLERQYRNSRETIGKLMFKLPEQPSSPTGAAYKYIQQLKAAVANLEEAEAGLQAQLAAATGND